MRRTKCINYANVAPIIHLDAGYCFQFSLRQCSCVQNSWKFCWICKWRRRLIRLTEMLLNLCTTCLKLTKYSCISCPTMVCNKCSFSKTVRSLTVGSLENQLATADFATTKGKQQHPIGRAKVTNSSTNIKKKLLTRSSI